MRSENARRASERFYAKNNSLAVMALGIVEPHYIGHQVAPCLRFRRCNNSLGWIIHGRRLSRRHVVVRRHCAAGCRSYFASYSVIEIPIFRH
jgi:hypothetical protein